LAPRPGGHLLTDSATPSLWKLAIEDDEGQQTSLELAQGEYSVGRAESCGIRLNERNISRAHCTLRRVGDGWQLQDDDSYNGTFINGQRVVDTQPLSLNDIIQLGDYRLELLDAALAMEGAATSRRRPNRLVMVIGPTPGKEFSLDGERRTAGRAEEADVSIDHASVSRLHCELINLGGGRWEVVDKDSSNGMRVNGMTLRRGIIEPGDALELGDVRLKFVKAGKFFRPASSASGIPIAHSLIPGATSMVPPPERPAARRLLMGGALVALVALVGYLLIPTKPGETAPAEQPVVESESEARGNLANAVKFAEDDLDLAHKVLQRIPPDSPVRSDPSFREIEDRWAQSQIAKALDSDDRDEATGLLNEVADADTVSTERRYQAIDILKDMGVTELPTVPLPRPPRVGKTRPKAPAAPEDIYEDDDGSPSKPSKPTPSSEDVYDDPAPKPATNPFNSIAPGSPPPPASDVYEAPPPPPPPRRPVVSDDPYD
jgi:pSer/pThr/pTyr-binding forkhead associated (FHA) protein